MTPSCFKAAATAAVYGLQIGDICLEGDCIVAFGLDALRGRLCRLKG